MPDTPSSTPEPRREPIAPGVEHETKLGRDLKDLRQRLSQEASAAVGMIEAAISALWELDSAAAEDVLRRDDQLDREEVAVEEAVFRLMTLRQPVARDFRTLAFVLKVNGDVERVGDHACSIAKITKKLAEHPPPYLPTALRELGERVPVVCQQLLRALVADKADAAKAVVAGDKTLDQLNRRLFDETVAMMKSSDDAHAAGLLVFRAGRELERVGDLMTNIAEDIVYLVTGEIVRHERKRLRAGRQL
jgi:phosphate transport system protein